MHNLPATLSHLLTSIAPILPYLVIGLILWLLAKKGNVSPGLLILAVLAGVILAGTPLGPAASSIVSTVSFGYLH